MAWRKSKNLSRKFADKQGARFRRAGRIFSMPNGQSINRSMPPIVINDEKLKPDHLPEEFQ